ncbi:MAG: rhomboid family intramembrane serine protease [Bacteroidaceae bacterium]|nr:rhomboid family intramembrane serine protease [Bacteroidaceae bacterium]
MKQLPEVTKNLLIVNVLVFLASYVASTRYNVDLNSILGLHFFGSEKFRLYQFFTYMFMHSTFEHLFFNMFAVWMFGRILENVWGPGRFLFYYVVCGVGAGLIQETAQYFEFMPVLNNIKALSALPATEMVPIDGVTHTAADWLVLHKTVLDTSTVGASGAVYGILLAFAMLFPNQQLFIIPIPVPIKAKWLIIGYFVLELVLALVAKGDGVAHIAHLGGMVFGFLLILYWRKHPSGNGYFRR